MATLPLLKSPLTLLFYQPYWETEICKAQQLSAFSYLRKSEESKIFLPITPKSRISEPTLPEEMYDQWHKGGYMNNPWSAPGSAKLYGGSCGANGGNPNGCGMGMLM